MALETGTYISDLVTTNPPNTDGVSQADDHLRLIKSTVKATFPNITGPVTLTQAQLNAAARTNAANTFTANQGIGVAPSVALDMAGEFLIRGAAAAGSVLRVTPDATTGANGVIIDTSWITGGAGPLIFKMASTERMRLDSTGNLGIGTTALTSKFVLSSASGSTPNNTTGNNVARLQSTQTAGVGVGPSLLFEGQTGNSTANYAFAGIQGFKDSAVASNYSGSLAFFTQNTGGGAALDEKMRIEGSTGNVGIGTNGPTAKLDIVGPAGGTSLRLTDNTNSTLTVKHESPGNLVTYESVGTAAQRWITNSVERMRIDAAGAVTIGGSPVISASGTAAQGDVLYHNGTAWARLPAGTSGQVLKTNGAGANPSWVTPTVGGMTLLATLATTSGASVPSGTLNLTPYRRLFVSFNGISAANSNAVLSLNGVTLLTMGTAPSTTSLWVDIDLATGLGLKITSSAAGGDAYSITTATTSFSVAVAATTFDAGSVQIYGIA